MAGVFTALPLVAICGENILTLQALDITGFSTSGLVEGGIDHNRSMRLLKESVVVSISSLPAC
jgi:hypothetical protein